MLVSIPYSIIFTLSLTDIFTIEVISTIRGAQLTHFLSHRSQELIIGEPCVGNGINDPLITNPSPKKRYRRISLLLQEEYYDPTTVTHVFRLTLRRSLRRLRRTLQTFPTVFLCLTSSK